MSAINHTHLTAVVSRLSSRPKLAYADMLRSVVDHLECIIAIVEAMPEAARSRDVTIAISSAATFVRQAKTRSATAPLVYEAADAQETLLRLLTRTVRMDTDMHGMVREGLLMTRAVRQALYADGFRVTGSVTAKGRAR